MKKCLITIILILFSFCLISCTVSEKENDYKITDVTETDESIHKFSCRYSDTQREFILHLPLEYGEETPVLIMLHGYSGSSEGFQRDSGMNKTADEYGYAVVYPQAISDPTDKTSGTGWNSGLKDDGNDDVGFLVALTEYLQAEYGLQKDIAFAAGFSNGAFMMYRLACEAPDTFRAVASVAGFMTGKVWKEKSDTASIGILQINGTKDDVIPLEIEGKPNTFGDRPSINQVIAYWREANSLDLEEQTQLSPKAAKTTYYSDSNQNQVCYIEIQDGSHSWPQENFAGFKTNEVILDFFNQFR